MLPGTEGIFSSSQGHPLDDKRDFWCTQDTTEQRRISQVSAPRAQQSLVSSAHVFTPRDPLTLQTVLDTAYRGYSRIRTRTDPRLVICS